MISTYKELVQKAVVDPLYTTGDLERQYLELGLPMGTGLKATEVMNGIKAKAAACIIASDDDGPIDYNIFHQLLKALVYELVITDSSDTSFLDVSESLRNCAPGNKKYVPVDQWLAAITWAKAYQAIHDRLYPPPAGGRPLRFSHPRAYDTALSLKYLLSQGCVIHWQEGDIIVVSGLDDVLDNLERLIAEIGGQNLLRTLFSATLAKAFKPGLNRYVYVHTVAPNPNNMYPVVPFGYLLNLAAKYPQPKKHDPSKVAELNDKLKVIIQTAAHLLKILDVQPYDYFQKVLRSPDTLVQGLYDQTTFDAAFSIPQSDPDMELDMLPVLFQWVNNSAFESCYSFGLADYFRVMKSILDSSKGTFGPVTISESQLQEMLRSTETSRDKVHLILKAISQQVPEVNAGYRSIADYSATNVSRIPLVQLGPTHFLLYDGTWSSMGFFETLARLTRELFDKGKSPDKRSSDKKIGMALEDYLSQTFIKYGVTAFSGKYMDLDEKEKECDFVIEGSRVIVLIEVKKKQLTPAAMTGDMASLLLDLTSSLLESQVQAGKAELTIKSQGFIEVSKAGSSQRIYHKGRDVIRLSVTQYDFYGLQDRITAKQILRTLVERDLVVNPALPENIKAGFARQQPLISEWKNQYSRLCSIDPAFAENPFFSSWFLSMAQVFMLLRGAGDNDGFIRNILKTKNLSLSSNNFYYEHLNSNSLDKAGSGMVFFTPDVSKTPINIT